MKKRFLAVVAGVCVLSALAAEKGRKASEEELMSKFVELGLLSSLGAEGHGCAQAHGGAPTELSDAAYKAICRDLEDISGLELTRDALRARVVGEINDVDDWARYRRVLERYGALIADYVTFRPGAKLVDALRAQVASLGFEIAESASPEKPGVVALAYENGLLRLTGWFLSEADVKAVRDVVAMQAWLAADAQAKDGRVPCELRLGVVDRLVDVGVVFVNVSREAEERFGNLLADGKILDFKSVGYLAESLRNFVPENEPEGGRGGYLRVKSDISGVVEAFAKDGTLTARASGHATLNTREMTERSKYHKGGKMIIKVPGAVSGGDVKEVEYGFTIDCLGRFIRRDELALDLQLERSSQPQVVSKDTGDYNQQKVDLKTRIACRLGQTVILAGSHESSSDESGPTGFAFLRRVPVLGWIFSGGSSKLNDEHFLILVSPTLLAPAAPLAERPSAENEKLEEQARPKLKEEVEEKERVPAWYERFYFWKWC